MYARAKNSFNGRLVKLFTSGAELIPKIINNLIVEEQPRNRVNILYFPKFGLNQDIISVFGGQPYGVYSLDRLYTKLIYGYFLPRHIDSNNYKSSDPSIISQKTKLRHFWGYILSHFNFDIIITGNFAYAEEQELFTAAEEIGIPVVAIHKECLKTPGRFAFWKKVYTERRNSFPGSLICAYNHIEKKLMMESGTSDNVVVTGMPRLDRYFNSNITPKRPAVLFFSFHSKTGLPTLGRKTNEGSVDEKIDIDLAVSKLAKTCHLKMLEIAKKHPEIDVVVKSKVDRRSIADLGSFYSKSDFPENFKIIKGGDPYELIVNSTVIIGWITAAIFEALACGKPVIFPMFYEAVSDEISPYLLNLGTSVEYVYSPEELEIKILDICTGKIASEPNNNKVLDTYMGNTDGKASQRVRDAIEKIVGDK